MNPRDEVLREFAEIEGSLFQSLAMADEIVRLKTELDEQCRLNAMGSEREAALLAKLAAVEAERDALQVQVVKWWGKDVLGRTERILAALREPSAAVTDDRANETRGGEG